MPAKKIQLNEIDRYIAAFPKDTQVALEQVRATIRSAAPEAEEVISYKMPAYQYHGMLVYFAGYAKHIGFYPMPSALKKFQQEISVYKNAKGSVQFPLNQPVPVKLIDQMVRFRVKENLEKAAAKKIPKTCPEGHRYYKSSDCPVCPVCEAARKPGEGFLALLSAPARRALENKGISTLKQLSRFTEAAILSLHGMGPGSLPKLRSALKEAGLSFKK